MKKLTVIFMIGLLTRSISQAQGVVYLSNLGQASSISQAIGSDAWFAESIQTGTNAGGYMLNSVQLGMTNATGNPNGFSVMIYSSLLSGEYYPNNDLDTLGGSDNPAASGVFTYTPTLNLLLSPNTIYFLVLTAGTPIANGAYEWNLASSNYNRNGHWFATSGAATSDVYKSSNGLNWTLINTALNVQYAITAAPVPEPSPSGLFGLGGLLLAGSLFHRKARRSH